MEKIIKREGNSIPQIVIDFKREFRLNDNDFTYEIVDEGKKTFFGLFRKSPVIMKFSVRNISRNIEKINGKIKQEKKRTRTPKPSKKVESKPPDTKDSPAKEKQPQNRKKPVNSQNKTNTGSQKETKKNHRDKKSEIDESIVAEVRTFLEEFLKKAGENNPELTADVEENYQYIFINRLENPGFFIGKEGRMIEALQYLVNCLVENRLSRKERTQSRSMQVIIDIEDYRKKHEKTVQNITKNLIEKVNSRKKSITMESMNSADRRIVHKFVENYDDIGTMTVGKGNLKRIVLYPAKENDRPDQQKKQQRKRRPRPRPGTQPAPKNQSTVATSE